jgi:hypothetical protein
MKWIRRFLDDDSDSDAGAPRQSCASWMSDRVGSLPPANREKYEGSLTKPGAPSLGERILRICRGEMTDGS